MRVLLYATCVVDQLWPEVGLASARLLQHFGHEVVCDPDSTCCGQPFANCGYPLQAQPLALRLVEQFERSAAAAVVLPSGSCATQIQHYAHSAQYPASLRARMAAMAACSYELSQFLQQHGHLQAPGRFAGRVAWHDGCHGLRELGIHAQPRQLLRSVAGLELVELPIADACCGFGGAFTAKLPELSVAIADHKLAAVHAAGVDVLASGDPSCLLHLRSRLQQQGSPVRCMHLAELLAPNQPEPA